MICLLLLLLITLSSCVSPRGGEATDTSDTTAQESVSESAALTEQESERATVSETEESVREPVSDGFPNEVESDGTKRY